jgi:hypothetical protein
MLKILVQQNITFGNDQTSLIQETTSDVTSHKCCMGTL